MEEKPERLAPTSATIKKIFALSGNRCAFPGCRHEIISSNGDFVAQLAHIEAAEEKGPRFRKEMTNEERRHPTNLLLLCYKHHIETNDLSVEEMRKMKETHEGLYDAASDRIIESFIDRTKAQTGDEAKDGMRFVATMNWSNVTSEMIVPDLRKLLGRLREIPRGERQLLVTAIERREKGKVRVSELETVTGKSGPALRNALDLLEKYGFIKFEPAWSDDPAGEDNPYVASREDRDGWDPLNDLYKFSVSSGIALGEIVVDLRFDLLDV